MTSSNGNNSNLLLEANWGSQGKMAASWVILGIKYA
jgi:hypothetical protein